MGLDSSLRNKDASDSRHALGEGASLALGVWECAYESIEPWH